MQHVLVTGGAGTLGRLVVARLSAAGYHVRGLSRIVLPLWLPGKIARSFRRGDNTCPLQAAGQITWDEWLKQKYSRLPE